MTFVVVLFVFFFDDVVRKTSVQINTIIKSVPRSFCVFYVIRIAAHFPSTFDYGVRVSETSD